MEKKNPNIFSYATSELSQDAMFAWLLMWSAPEYAESDPELHQVGKQFVRLLAGKDSGYLVESIKVGRQWEGIDIWAEINENTVLVIEDKTGTSVHDNQLRRYMDSIGWAYAGKRSDLCYAYVKTGDEPYSVLKSIENIGFRPITRSGILSCLDEYQGNDTLLVSYREHLRKIEESVNSYKVLPEREWGWNAWKGFYKELELRVGIDSWGYVSNPSGGFLGAWWHFMEIGDCEMYLQFEQGKLCFKISYEGEEDRSEVRYRQYSRLLAIAHDRFPEIRRPDRFGTGTYMTIAVVDEKIVFGEGLLNMDVLVSRLMQYETLIDECCEILSKENPHSRIPCT